VQGHLRAQALAEACVAGHPEAGSPVAVYRHSQTFACRELVHAEAAVVAVAVVFRIRRCAAQVVESSQADLEGDLG
jgi:hypothetical protein